MLGRNVSLRSAGIPSLEEPKTMDETQGSLSWGGSHPTARDWNWVMLKIPSNLSYSMIKTLASILASIPNLLSSFLEDCHAQVKAYSSAHSCAYTLPSSFEPFFFSEVLG